jgi:phosphate transport system substrate-binding protein
LGALGGLAAGAGLVGAAGAAAMANRPPAANPVTPASADAAITLSPIGTKAAYVAWQADDAAKAALKQQGGQTHQVRLYDVTHLDLSHQAPHSMQAFTCPESTSDQIVPIPQADRDYIAEVGYAKPDGQWLKMLRSKHLRVPDGSVARAFGSTALDGAAMGAAALGGAAGVIAAHAPAERHITLNATTNAFLLDGDQVNRLQHQTAVSKDLQPGHYQVRITQGSFSYRPLTEHAGEPLVMLWMKGGQVVNAKTNHPVSGAWTTLNGYGDTLDLQVVEPTTLLAFFVDTNVQDNNGEVTVVVEQVQQ